MARALDPGVIPGPLRDVIRLCADWGITEHLADPQDARSQCIRFSSWFESMCVHHGIPAGTVSGFCFTRVPPSAQVPPEQMEEPWAGHTAVRAPAPVTQENASGEIVIDWTARQFDPAAPVPLVVTLAHWREFWRDLAASPQRSRKPALPAPQAARNDQAD